MHSCVQFILGTRQVHDRVADVSVNNGWGLRRLVFSIQAAGMLVQQVRALAYACGDCDLSLAAGPCVDGRFDREGIR